MSAPTTAIRPGAAYRRSAPGVVCALSLLLVGASCRDSTDPAAAGPPAALQIVGGNGQLAEAGTELPEPLVVKVVDAAGRPVRGQLVSFRVVAGGGEVFAGAGITNEGGVAQDRWTLGTSTADSQKVEARAVDSGTGAPLVFGVFRATGRCRVDSAAER